MNDYYKRLSAIDVKPYLEQKQNLSYLSWAYALHIQLSEDPTANWEVLDPQIMGDGTMMVWTSVTAFGITRKQWLPVMDHRNKAVANPDSFLVNKNLQRCLVKNIAAFGLGLSVYAGEDLPEDIKTKAEIESEKQAQTDVDEQTYETLMRGILSATTAEELAQWTGDAKAFVETGISDQHKNGLRGAIHQANQKFKEAA